MDVLYANSTIKLNKWKLTSACACVRWNKIRKSKHIAMLFYLNCWFIFCGKCHWAGIMIFPNPSVPYRDARLSPSPLTQPSLTNTHLQWLRVCVCTRSHSVRDLCCLIMSRSDQWCCQQRGRAREWGVKSFLRKSSHTVEVWVKACGPSDVTFMWGFVWPVMLSFLGLVITFLFYQ